VRCYYIRYPARFRSAQTPAQPDPASSAGITGFVQVRGATEEGQRLYARARALRDAEKAAELAVDGGA